MLKRLLLTALVWTLATGIAAASYTIVLKKGGRIVAKEKPRYEGGKAYFQYLNGTAANIDLALVDVPATEKSNASAAGGNLELTAPVDIGTKPQGGAPKKSLSDLIKERNQPLQMPTSSPSAKPPAKSPGAAPPVKTAQSAAAPQPLPSAEKRTPLNDQDIAHRLRNAYADMAIRDIELSQGSAGAILVAATTDDEQAVFNTISVSARTLKTLGGEGRNVAALELDLRTTTGQRAGRFRMTPEQAEAIVAQKVSLADYFVKNVIF